MGSNGSGLEHLSRAECMRLMEAAPVGRIVYTRRALPAVELVSFALVNGAIVIRTADGGKLAAAVGGAVVAFEADSVDSERRSGWSVTAIGDCRAVTDQGDCFIEITPVIVTGRRLGAGHRFGGGRCALSARNGCGRCSPRCPARPGWWPAATSRRPGRH